MNRILKYLKGRKGITLVWMAFMLAVLLMLAGMAIDIAYMYYVKNQLQVAADAAALAGAANLASGTNVLQTPAREQAWKFACENKAAGSSVYLVADGTDCSTFPGNLNNGNNSTGDIVVGFWDSANRTFTPGDGSTVQINAVKVVASRTGEDAVADIKNGGNQVRVFLGQIFRILGGEGWPFMSARASAIAGKSGLPILPIPICVPRCNETTDFNNSTCPGKKLVFNPPDDEFVCGVAWAKVVPCPPDCQKPSTQYLVDYLANPQSTNICEKCIKTSQGEHTEAKRALADAVENNKEEITIKYTDNSNPANSWEATIEGWRALIPIIEINETFCSPPPSKPCPGGQDAKYYVPAMAEVIVTKVDLPPSDDCPTCGNPRTGVTLIGTESTSTFKVTKIKCLTCGSDDLKKLVGTVKLVK